MTRVSRNKIMILLWLWLWMDKLLHYNKIQTHFSPCSMNDPMTPSILRIASIKPRCWLLTASAAWSAPMTVIPGLWSLSRNVPSPGASGVCPHLPPPIGWCQQEVAGDQQIETSSHLAPKLMGRLSDCEPFSMSAENVVQEVYIWQVVD